MKAKPPGGCRRCRREARAAWSPSLRSPWFLRTRECGHACCRAWRAIQVQLNVTSTGQTGFLRVTRPEHEVSAVAAANFDTS